MTLTDTQRSAYADLQGILRRVAIRDRQQVQGAMRPILLSGPSPLCDSDEDVVGRYGGVLDMRGTFREAGAGPDTYAVGQIALAAAELLVTTERIVCSLTRGSTRAGEARDDETAVVFDLPWEAVDAVETPAKTTLAHRVAGGRPVALCGYTFGAARVSFVVRSELSPPPGSAPVRKVEPDELMRTLVQTAGRWRGRTAHDAEAGRLARIMAGAYLRDEDSLVGWLVDPETTKGEVDPPPEPGAPAVAPPTAPEVPTVVEPPAWPRVALSSPEPGPPAPPPRTAEVTVVDRVGWATPTSPPPDAGRGESGRRRAALAAALAAVIVVIGGVAGFLLVREATHAPAVAHAAPRTVASDDIPAAATATPSAALASETPAPAATAAPVSGTTAELLPAGSPSQFGVDIRALLLSFHEDVVDRDYRAAWDLLSTRKRAKELRVDGYAQWRKAQESLTPYLDPMDLRVTVRSVDRRTGVALVAVSGMRWSAPRARCAAWSGLTWVKYEDGAWRYDPGYSTTPQRARAYKHQVRRLLGGSC